MFDRPLFSSVAACGIAIAALASPASAQTRFNDIQGHWGQACLQELGDRRILNGYPDGSFRPNAPVTRAEFATILDSIFSRRDPVREAIEFADTDGHWAAIAITGVYERGFLSGYPNRRFEPNQNIPRVQALVALVNGLKYVPSQKDTQLTLTRAFTDAADIPSYATEAVAAAAERRMAINYPDATRLEPNRSATRGEIAAMLCQSLVEMVPDGAIASEYVTTVSLPEIRGVWMTNIDSDVLFSTEKLKAGLERLAALNFNTIYPTVWNWGYTLYPSEVAEATFGRSLDPEPGLQGRDMLAEAIKEGDRLGLRTIAWFEFGFMAPSYSEIAQRYPEWITSRSDGTQTKMEGEHERVWFNPWHPEVQEFILDLVVEIVTNYDVDGIQFDDHMGLPSEYGYDDFTVALYRSEHDGKDPPMDTKDPDWLKWRADKITEFMTRVFRAVKEIDEDCIVALSPNPQNFAYTEFLQDWRTWERRGLVEEIMLQVYRDDLDRFARELEAPEVEAARQNIPLGVGILTGLKNRPASLDIIQSQVAIARSRGLAGVSFFFYESLWRWTTEPVAEREEALRTLFPTFVSAPDVLED